MSAVEIITTAAAAIDLANKAITAANAGNVDEAMAFLVAAREHYAQASVAWEAAAGQEKAPGVSTEG